MYSLNKLIERLVWLKEKKKFVLMKELYESNPHLQHAILLRIDVERNLYHHERVAELLFERNIPATFYFHTRYNTYKPDVLKRIEALGHEVGFHHECLDRSRGNFEKARDLFAREVSKFREDGFNLKTVCSYGELGLKKVGYKTNHDLFKKFPELLNNLNLYGEVYTSIFNKWKPINISDTLRGNSQFFSKIQNTWDTPQLTHILVHPHWWHFNPLRSLFEVTKDIFQASSNKFIKRRSYKTVIQ